MIRAALGGAGGRRVGEDLERCRISWSVRFDGRMDACLAMSGDAESNARSPGSPVAAPESGEVGIAVALRSHRQMSFAVFPDAT